MKLLMKKYKLLLVLCLLLSSAGCVSTIVGEAVDLSIEVVKVPFKVVGAAVDVISGDDE